MHATNTHTHTHTHTHTRTRARTHLSRYALGPKFHVLLTSYETILKDKAAFKGINFEVRVCVCVCRVCVCVFVCVCVCVL